MFKSWYLPLARLLRNDVSAACSCPRPPLRSTVCRRRRPSLDGDKGIQFGPAEIRHLKVGIRIKAGGAVPRHLGGHPGPHGLARAGSANHQRRRVAEVRSVNYRNLDDGVKQMLITIPRLDSNEVAEAVLTLEISRKPILAPSETALYKIPTRPGRDIKKYLGASPFIESRNPRIRSLAREILKDKEAEPAWSQVEAIYDYVREHVEYRESELKGAIQTLSDGVGDCEAMTSLFIALCRAAKIPARMIWVMDHSYPEFYLEDDEGKGHWFPCQISGARAFGAMPETRPILQKGDNFAIPETRERRRYVATQLKASAVRGGSPQITEILQFVDPESAAAQP